MEQFKEQFLLLFNQPAGIFLAALLASDVLAIIIGMCFLAVFRIKKYLFNKNISTGLNSSRETLESIIAGDESRVDDFLELSKQIPNKILASLFIEYTHLLSGSYHDILIKLFSKTSLAEYAAKAARSKKWSERLNAIRLVELVPDSGREQLMLKMLNDKHPIIRMSAVLAAPLHPTTAIVGKMFTLLDSEESFELHALKDTIARLGPAAAKEMESFLDRMQGKKCHTVAFDIAGKLRDPALSAPLLRSLRHCNGEAKAAAARALGSYPDEEVAQELYAALRDSDESVRAMAAQSIGAIGYKDAVCALGEMLSDKSWTVRMNSAAALKKLGKPGIERLEQAVAGTDRYAADMAEYILSLPEYAHT